MFFVFCFFLFCLFDSLRVVLKHLSSLCVKKTWGCWGGGGGSDVCVWGLGGLEVEVEGGGGV